MFAVLENKAVQGLSSVDSKVSVIFALPVGSGAGRQRLKEGESKPWKRTFEEPALY